MVESSGDPGADYSLEDWERALTIHVGTAYACRQCKNLVMVTRGGVGVMELRCCGREMEKVSAGIDKAQEKGG